MGATQKRCRSIDDQSPTETYACLQEHTRLLPKPISRAHSYRVRSRTLLLRTTMLTRLGFTPGLQTTQACCLAGTSRRPLVFREARVCLARVWQKRNPKNTDVSANLRRRTRSSCKRVYRTCTSGSSMKRSTVLEFTHRSIFFGSPNHLQLARAIRDSPHTRDKNFMLLYSLRTHRT